MLFVGRITRQKGIIHPLVNAPSGKSTPFTDSAVRGGPRYAQIGREMTERIQAVSAERAGRNLDRGNAGASRRHPDVLALDGILLPICYEPFGIINLEAMACETAVVASAVGGIKEVVVPGETGLLVDLQLKQGTFDPVDPAKFAHDLAEAINTVARENAMREKFGRNGRRRVEEHFSWALSRARRSTSTALWWNRRSRERLNGGRGRCWEMPQVRLRTSCEPWATPKPARALETHRQIVIPNAVRQALALTLAGKTTYWPDYENICAIIASRQAAPRLYRRLMAWH